METLYVDRPQNTTLLLPPTSIVFHPDGDFPGKNMENSGKPNPKMEFKPPEHSKKRPIFLDISSQARNGFDFLRASGS
jgi:hypothetical protein